MSDIFVNTASGNTSDFKSFLSQESDQKVALVQVMASSGHDDLNQVYLKAEMLIAHCFIHSCSWMGLNWTNPSSAVPIQNTMLLMTLPADAPAPKGARPSVSTLLTTKLYMFSF